MYDGTFYGKVNGKKLTISARIVVIDVYQGLKHTSDIDL